jgi:hypothetical protein
MAPESMARISFASKRGTGKAMFYFRPISGTVDFSLPDEVAHGREGVQLRLGARDYRVRVTISDERSLQTALELARIAWGNAGANRDRVEKKKGPRPRGKHLTQGLFLRGLTYL